MNEESVTIILPLPGKRLSPNCPCASFRGRMAKAAVAKKYRALAEKETLQAGIDSGPWDLAEAQATFFHDKKRRRDGANFNAQLKSAVDGIIDAGLAKDDDYEHWSLLPPKFEIDKEFPRVEINITRKERGE